MTVAVGGKIMIFINLQKNCKTSAPNYVQCTFLRFSNIWKELLVQTEFEKWCNGKYKIYSGDAKIYAFLKNSYVFLSFNK